MIRFVVVKWKHTRFWAVYDRVDAGWTTELGSTEKGLVAVCVYRKGAHRLAGRLNIAARLAVAA